MFGGSKYLPKLFGKVLKLGETNKSPNDGNGPAGETSPIKCGVSNGFTESKNIDLGWGIIICLIKVDHSGIMVVSKP